MKKFIYILFLLVFSLKVNAAITWQQVSGAPDGVTTLAVAPSGRIWVGAGTGVSYSDDNGGTWNLANTGIGGTPTYVANMIVTRAGTPLATIRISSVTQMWRYNAGSWSAISSTGSSFPGDQLQAADGSIVRASDYSIYRSTDDGATFTSINSTYFASSGGGAGYGTNAIYSMVMDSNGTLYAGTDHDGVHYSNDNGYTWHWLGIYEVNPGQVYPMGNISPMKFNASRQLVIGTGFSGVFVNSASPLSPIFCINPPTCTCLPTSCGSWTYESGYPSIYNSVDDTVHDFLLLPNGDMLLHGGRMYRSTDGGLTWALDDSGFAAGPINNEDSGGTRSVFHHTMAYGADKKIYVGIQPTGYGVYRSSTTQITGGGTVTSGKSVLSGSTKAQ